MSVYPQRDYQPRPVRFFAPARIVLAKGSEERPEIVEGICQVYPEAEVIEALDTPHNKVSLDHSDLLSFLSEGKQTLVLGRHGSAVKFSKEKGNSCPNYWHFSPYGFCPYGCHYCYLAATKGVQPSPTVKLFLNLHKMLDYISNKASRLSEPTSFYVGKLQDGLALDPLSGYSREIVPFFARQKFAYLTVLTKSDDVSNLLDLEHGHHSILSWTVGPAAMSEKFEPNTPSVEERLSAMRRCSLVGYPVRAVVMPIIPVPDWEDVYGEFLKRLVSEVSLARITLGCICSYPRAMHITELKLGRDNAISKNLSGREEKSLDGRKRFPRAQRELIYRHLVSVLQEAAPGLEISLCLEDPMMFASLGLESGIGRCNCMP